MLDKSSLLLSAQSEKIQESSALSDESGSTHKRVCTMPFVIKRDGTWLYKGSPVRRKNMVCLFASMLTRDIHGHYWLDNPVERGRISVEDAPLVAVALYWQGCGKNQVLSFRTNTDQLICAGREHALRVKCLGQDIGCEEGSVPYLHIRDGEGDFAVEARISRAVYYELVALAVPGYYKGKEYMGVWSENVFFPLGHMEKSEG